jgi:hypothetical protein
MIVPAVTWRGCHACPNPARTHTHTRQRERSWHSCGAPGGHSASGWLSHSSSGNRASGPGRPQLAPPYGAPGQRAMRCGGRASARGGTGGRTVSVRRPPGPLNIHAHAHPHRRARPSRAHTCTRPAHRRRQAARPARVHRLQAKKFNIHIRASASLSLSMSLTQAHTQRAASSLSRCPSHPAST